MYSPSSVKRFCTLLLASVCISGVRSLDIAFDKIACDDSLPAYVANGDVRMTCNNGQDTRCSFGQEVNIRGTLQYHNLTQTSNDGLGYASGNLRLLSVEYSLFNEFEIDFCGDWVQPYNSTDDDLTCPALDGFYYFNIDYVLPFDDDDLTTWFATGWSGESSLVVRSDSSDDGDLLADCQLSWHTYVTPSNTDGWKTMPSAAQAGIVLLSILTAIMCCCTYMVCCKRRQKHVTDVGYYTDFEDYRPHKEKKKKKKQSDGGVDDVEASRMR